MELMIDNGIHHVLVIMSKRVVGIVSVIDIIQIDKARTFNPFADSDSYVPAR
jgi:signal-transduction protein with cAMP-binding, CBS, and nucleotidyltransferase domain